MPNWVYNGLTIEGPKESIFKLVEQMNKPFTTFTHEMTENGMTSKDFTYENPIFSFWNIIAPTDFEAYKGDSARSTLDSSDPNWWSDTQALAKTDNSWYNWNIRNWGVKWDVANSGEGYKNTYMEGPVANDGTDPKDPWGVY